ncbi:hypothetical protein B0I35DRAFT_418225 [Stachybotrys elegans]|uniref:FAD-binding PCMH-type domain-containing protein n=1 Tax=Stachybotrys elegans TaxID=80388 RepID=A0A8K0WWK4_9HYPO|nr:hypothetical protein B0I35DRAFT_418225 [Stachybotrys elegans]
MMLVQAALLIVLAASAHAAAPYCLAGDDCFPSPAEFEQLEETLQGNLIRSQPYGAPCYAATYDADACLNLVNTVRTFGFREEEAAAVMYVNNEITPNGSGCPVPMAPADGSAPPAIDGECVLGNMAAYVVNATSADDVQVAVRFAAEHNLRLRIKNSGHDYTARSTGEGAFTIWTRHMDDVLLVEDFVPEGGDGPGVDVFSAGPGLNAQGVIDFGGANARLGVTGYPPSVGAVGGYLLGGGMGPLAPLFGMAVDNVQQFEVVTADGEKRIVNEYINPDLFWALRGGGGAFAAVTRAWIRVYPALAAVNTVTGTLVCTNTSSYEGMVDALVDLQVPLRTHNHTGIWQLGGSTRSLLLIDILPLQDGAEIPDLEASMELLEPLTTAPGCSASFRPAQFLGNESYVDAYYNAIWATAQLGSNPGRNIVDASRLVSYDMMLDPGKVSEIKDLIKNNNPSVPFIWQNNCGGAMTRIAPDATSVNPTWREAMSWVVLPVTGPWSGLTTEQGELLADANRRLQEVFGSPSYYNEQSGGLINWQDSWWGTNYDRLLSIKQQIDPDGVFSCPLCVGSEFGV